MVSTRSGSVSETSPKQKTDGKRAATDSASSPPAKRGKTSSQAEKTNKQDDKFQQTIEDTMQGVEKTEDDSTIKKQIDEDEKIARKISNEQAATAKQEDTKAEALREAEAKVEQLKREQAEESGDKSAEKAGDNNGVKNGEKKDEDKGEQQNGSSATTVPQSDNANKPDRTATDSITNQQEPSVGAEKKQTSNVEGKNAFDEVKADAGEVKEAANEEQESKDNDIANNNDSVVQDTKREDAMPSSILEKGIIYFFFRGRVGVEDPNGVEDIARSYIVLRPIPIGAKLGEGPLEDSGNARLLALPKKVLPKTQNDKFLMFVDKTGCSVKDLKDHFASNEYSTKTVGTSVTPAVTPIAEGVYAITSTAGASHLAYQLTIPTSLGEVQTDLGLNEKGSFVLSVKNPTAPGPANATLDNPADYPEELMKEFRGLRWTPLKPAFLDYQATQFLIIGEGVDGGLGNAVKANERDEKDESTIAPEEELEKLDDENTQRIDGLKGDDAVFADLGLSSKEYPKMETTW